MRNRAKCKSCHDLIESVHEHDYVMCKCGEISIDGGKDLFRCSAREWTNFIRIDDEGNEVIPKIIDVKDGETSKAVIEDTESPPLTRADYLKGLDEMISIYERLDQHSGMKPITQREHLSFLYLIRSIVSMN